MDGSILTISDAIWPGLSPDLLSIFLVVAIQAKGECSYPSKNVRKPLILLLTV